MFERREIDAARAGCTVVTPGKLSVVNMKTGKPMRQRFEVHSVANEAEVLLDLRMAGVVPVSHGGAGEFAEEKTAVALERKFLQRLAVFTSKLDAAGFSVGQDFVQRFVHALDEFSLPGLALFS